MQTGTRTDGEHSWLEQEVVKAQADSVANGYAEPAPFEFLGMVRVGIAIHS